MKTTIILITSVLTFTLKAQDIKDKSLLVEKEFNTEIYNVNPLFSFSDVKTMPKSNLEAFNDTLRQISRYIIETPFSLKPIAFKAEQNKSGKRGYVNINKGIYNILTAEAGYNFYLDNYFDVGLDLSFSNWTDNTVINKNIKTVTGQIQAKYYITKNVSAEFGVENKQNTYGLYGTSLKLPENSANRIINETTITGNINSFKQNTGAINYDVDLDLTITSLDKNSEKNLTIVPVGSYMIKNGSSIKFKSGVYHSTSKTTGNRTNFQPTIGYSLTTKKAIFDFGAVANINSQEYSVWPRIKVNYQLSDNNSIQINSDQIINLNNIKSLSGLNPFVNIHSSSIQELEKISNVNLSSENRIGSQLSASLLIDYSINKNSQNFRGAASEGLIDYSLTNYKAVGIHSKATYDFAKSGIIASLASGYTYYYDKSSTLYNRPNWNVSPSLSYTGIDKLHISAQLNLVGNAKQADIPSKNLESGMRKNVLFQASYRPLESIKVYINGDNLLNDNYYIFNNYQVFGRSVSGGVLFTF